MSRIKTKAGSLEDLYDFCFTAKGNLLSERKCQKGNIKKPKNKWGLQVRSKNAVTPTIKRKRATLRDVSVAF